MELQRWKKEEEQRLEEARIAEETALALAEREKARSKAAIEHAEAARRLAESEAQKRINAEKKALQHEERNKTPTSMAQSERYRKYTIDEIEQATEFFAKSRKIGEGGYGPVFKCRLDHTAVAVKVLRPDAAQGRSQFQQEVITHKDLITNIIMPLICLIPQTLLPNRIYYVTLV